MIHYSSSDPVLLKKISLKIWSLRDEIEARIQSQIAEGGSSEDLDLMKIRDQYTPKHLQTNNVLSIKSSSELDSSEDEMARAMAETEPAAEATNEPPAATEENITNLSATPVENPNVISITLDTPSIAEEKMSKGKTVLSEINMDKMYFFCNKAFTEGQSIVIQFCIPKSFIVNADVLYCRSYNLKSRIISQNNYNHRALIRFNFLKEGERALLRQFLQSIEPDIPIIVKKAESKSEGADDGLTGLEDFGL